MNIYEKLMTIQSDLNCPKTLHNKFGNYYYRSAETILEALKPLLKEVNCTLRLCDNVVLVGENTYIEASAILTDCETGETITNTAYAREEMNKKGMDASQITGSCSSYARKYALNGLFAIDDVKDSDATNTHGKEEPKDELDKKIEEGELKANEPITDKELKLLREVLEKRGDGAIDKCKEFFKVSSLEVLTRGQYVDAIRMMNKEKKK